MIQKKDNIETRVAYTDFSKLYRNIFEKSALSDERYMSDETIERFYALMQCMNDSDINITSITSAEDIICRHYADSISAERYIPINSSVIDVGTGGGFPAIPLAIVRPDIEVTALDSTAKKINYVKKTHEELGLNNVFALCGRAEELCNASKSNLSESNVELFYREKFDVAISRAVAALPILCELCLPFVRPGGIFVALKGASADEELKCSREAVRILGGEMAENKIINLYTEKEILEHHVLIFQKKRSTPIIYPRKFAKINKKPL